MRLAILFAQATASSPLAAAAPENPPLVRPLITIAAVALLSGLLSHWHQAQGQREGAAARADGTTWIRTVDGWEPSIVLQSQPEPATTPALHPLLVAGFFLSASLLALLAFPADVAGGGTARC